MIIANKFESSARDATPLLTAEAHSTNSRDTSAELVARCTIVIANLDSVEWKAGI